VRNEIGTVDPSIKTGNYLNSVLALIEAKKRGAGEACMLNAHGKLTECTTSNIFFVRDGIAHTPSLESGILAGVTRSGVLRIARDSGVSVREGSFDADELRRAEEAFITSTTRGIMPIGTVDGRPVGKGAAARPVTRRLVELFARDVDRFVKAG
jgi:branched-chain amino acid aminotransferase